MVAYSELRHIHKAQNKTSTSSKYEAEGIGICVSISDGGVACTVADLYHVTYCHQLDL